MPATRRRCQRSSVSGGDEEAGPAGSGQDAADGGKQGAPGIASLASGPKLPGKGALTVPSGDRLRLEVPGGGGFGDPFTRTPQQVAEDVLDELITPEEARSQYGVVVSAGGKVDAAATDRLRAAGSD